MIEGTIRGRIGENVRRSSRLFPGVPAGAIPATVERFARDAEVSLAESVFVLISGAMRVGGSTGHPPLEVVADGTFADMPVVGIVSMIGAPDGEHAMVVRDTVAVMLPRSAIEQIQDSHPQVRRVWDAMCGERMGEFQASLTDARVRSATSHYCPEPEVRRQKRATDSRISSAVFVQTNGVGAALVIAR